MKETAEEEPAVEEDEDVKDNWDDDDDDVKDKWDESSDEEAEEGELLVFSVIFYAFMAVRLFVQLIKKSLHFICCMPLN